MDGRKNEIGFTLIEMSIVLVIIGLVVGGVLVGQNLIKATQMRAEAAQFEKWATALNTYYGKYDALPGDDPNAATNGLGISGNGNGMIEFHSGAPGESEGQNAWVHLANAGLYGGPSSITSCAPGQGMPNSIMLSSAGFGMFTADLYGYDTNNGTYPYLSDGHIWVRMTSGSTGGCDMGETNMGLSSAQLFAFDTKYDDGMPYLGRIRAMGQDGISADYSMQVMCPALIDCTYPINIKCVNGTSGSFLDTNQYLRQSGMACPYAYKLQ